MAEEQDILQETQTAPPGDGKPKFDPNKQHTPVQENKPAFDPQKPFQKKNLGENGSQPLPKEQPTPLENGLSTTPKDNSLTTALEPLNAAMRGGDNAEPVAPVQQGFQDTLPQGGHNRQRNLLPPKPSTTTPSTKPSDMSLDEEINYYQQKDKEEKGNVGGYLWNKITGAVGGISNAAADNMMNLLSSIPALRGDASKEEIMKNFRQDVEPTIQNATTQLVGADVSKEKEKNYNDHFVTSALGGVASMVPAMGFPKGTGFILQAYDGALNSINNTEKGKDLPESTKTIYATGVGLANGALMAAGIDKIFGKETDKVATKLATDTFEKLLKDSKEPITADMFNAAIQESTKTLKEKIISAGGKIAKASATGALFGAGAEAVNVGAEKLTNKLTDQEVFEPKTWGQEFGRIAHAGAETAVAGFVLGGVHVPFAHTRDFINEKVSEAKTPEDIQKLKDEIIPQVQAGKLTPEQAQQISDTIDDYARVHSKIPIDTKNKTEVADKILQREDLKQQADKATDAANNVDEAFAPKIKEEADALNNRAAEVNNEITETAQKEPETKGTPEDISQPIEHEAIKDEIKEWKKYMNREERTPEDIEWTKNHIEEIKKDPIGYADKLINEAKESIKWGKENPRKGEEENDRKYIENREADLKKWEQVKKELTEKKEAKPTQPIELSTETTLPETKKEPIEDNRHDVGLSQEGNKFFIQTFFESSEDSSRKTKEQTFKQEVELTPEEKKELQSIENDEELDGKSRETVNRRRTLVQKIIDRNNLSDKVKISAPINEETNANEQTTKDTKQAEESGTTKEVVTETTQQAGGEKEPPAEPPTDKTVTEEEAGKEWTGISKAALKKQYGFTKAFDSKSDQSVANETMDRLRTSAQDNGITAEQQAANEVAAMKDKKGEASEHDIMTAAYHLLNLDEQLKKATDNTEIDNLISQRNDALETLRKLGNNAGRNLRLFGTVFKKSAESSIETARVEIKRILGVDEIPKTEADLDKSKLSNTDKNKVRPFVKAIEQLGKEIADINKKSESEIKNIDDKEVQDYIKKQIEKGLKEKGNKKTTTQKGKDFADKIRKLKTPKGGAKLDFTLGSWDVMIEGIAKLVEGGATIAEAIENLIKDKSISFKSAKDKDQAERMIISGMNKEEAIENINELKKDATSITPEMVNKGLINDVVDDYIHTDTPYDKVIPEATKELQEHLPETTEQQVQDAILRKGEFKQKTKKEILTEIEQKKADVKRLAATQSKLRALEAADEVQGIIGDNTLSAKDKKAAIEQRKSDFEKEVDKKIAEHEKSKKEAIDNIKKLKQQYKDLETERNRQLQKVSDLTAKLNKLKSGVREVAGKVTAKIDTPEIENLKKQVADADKALRKTEAEKRKVTRDDNKLQEKLKDIENEINHAKNEKTIFNKAIKEPKKANEQLKIAKQQLADAYRENGLRQEHGSKSDIKIAQDADNEIKDIKENKDLDETTKKEHIAAIEKERDAKLNLTRQGVLTTLRDKINNHISDLTDQQEIAAKEGDTETVSKIADLKKDLQNLHDNLKPNTENLKDQIDKADQDLNAIIKNNKGTEFENDLKDIQDEYHRSWQKTADEMQRQTLIESSQRRIKEGNRRLAAGQYSEIPTTTYEAQKDAVTARLQAESKKVWQKVNHLKEKAQGEGKETLIEKALNARRSWLIASFGAIEKVGVSAITKPVFDTWQKQTTGRLSGLLTGIKATELRNIGESFRQLKNESSANQFMKKRNNAYVDAIVNYEKAKQSGNTDAIKKAELKMKQAEVDNAASLAYLFINANSAIDIKQIMINAATDFDAAMSKYPKSYAAERSKLQGLGYWLESINRTHGAMKSLSHRQALVNSYIENLQHIQSREGKITDDSRMQAWDMAALEGEEGRFGESTKMSDKIGQWKSSESAAKRIGAKFLFPVAKIAINITKQGIDRAIPIEVMVRTLGTDAVKGMKLYEKDGIEFKNFADKYYRGVKRGFDSLPYEQKKYINTLIGRGLSGLAQYALVSALLSNGSIKYGGAWNDNDPFHKKFKRVVGHDGKELGNGEWEFFGERSPKLLNVALNHSPYSLPMSLAADYHQYAVEEGKGNNALKGSQAVVNEVYSRLPVTSAMDLMKGLIGGDEYKLERAVSQVIPTAKNVAEFFDKDKEGNVIDRKIHEKDDGFWGTTWNMAKKNLPFLRNTLPEKSNTGFGGGGASGTFHKSEKHPKKPTKHNY